MWEEGCNKRVRVNLPAATFSLTNRTGMGKTCNFTGWDLGKGF
jgi:hypothetical protein